MGWFGVVKITKNSAIRYSVYKSSY